LPQKPFPFKVKENDNNNSIINIIVDLALPPINLPLASSFPCRPSVVYIARFTHFYGAEAQPHLRILGIGKLTNSSFHQLYVLTLGILGVEN
jgi:hypothetical protein